MGPQNVNLNADEMLRVMAWLRDRLESSANLRERG